MPQPGPFQRQYLPPIAGTGATLRYHGFADEALEQSEGDGLTGTSVVINLYAPDADGVLVSLDRQVTAMVYDESLEFDEGAFVKIERDRGQWEIYWVGCGVQLAAIKQEDGEAITQEDGQPMYQE